MDIFDVIANRYSVRAYKPDPVPEETLGQVLEAARLAPTAANRQPVRVLVIHTEGREDALKRVYGRDWFVQPPLVLAVCGIHDAAWVRTRHDDKSYLDVDAAIVMDHMILAATALGLGTCWIGAFDPDVAREVLALPEGVEPIAFTPLGYPDVAPGDKKRKDLEEIVKYEHW